MKFWLWPCGRSNKSLKEAEEAIAREHAARKDVAAAAEKLSAKDSTLEELSKALTKHLKANHFGDLILDSMKRRDA